MKEKKILEAKSKYFETNLQLDKPFQLTATETPSSFPPFPANNSDSKLEIQWAGFRSSGLDAKDDIALVPPPAVDSPIIVWPQENLPPVW